MENGSVVSGKFTIELVNLGYAGFSGDPAKIAQGVSAPGPRFSGEGKIVDSNILGEWLGTTAEGFLLEKLELYPTPNLGKFLNFKGSPKVKNSYIFKDTVIKDNALVEKVQSTMPIQVSGNSVVSNFKINSFAGNPSSVYIEENSSITDSTLYNDNYNENRVFVNKTIFGARCGMFFPIVVEGVTVAYSTSNVGGAPSFGCRVIDPNNGNYPIESQY